MLLPPAFRRNGEGNVFTGVCPFTLAGEGGNPGRGVTLPRSGRGQYPRTGWGYPCLDLGWGYPSSRLGPRWGVVPQLEQHSVYFLRAFTQEDLLVLFYGVHANFSSKIDKNGVHYLQQ